MFILVSSITGIKDAKVININVILKEFFDKIFIIIFQNSHKSLNKI